LSSLGDNELVSIVLRNQAESPDSKTHRGGGPGGSSNRFCIAKSATDHLRVAAMALKRLSTYSLPISFSAQALTGGWDI